MMGASSIVILDKYGLEPPPASVFRDAGVDVFAIGSRGRGGRVRALRVVPYHIIACIHPPFLSLFIFNFIFITFKFKSISPFYAFVRSLHPSLHLRIIGY
ncbi:hypothetical protein L1987_50848 [Smallanthus sonchifolius]|uniref:Uncharacterized protein n=1 Tax=Smallanthus sonchifolius TaxID=185202 RepID=A0ACB9EPB4_9ASTR|nr:hypothetical protein L1987_50848 [Smallanthus sonchifolius]